MGLGVLVQAALAHSVPLKKSELAVRSLVIWGRINTRNGRDYIVASATPSPRMQEGKPVMDTMYLISQDGISWSDLPAVDVNLQETALKMDDMLQGDPAKKFYWPPKPEDEEEAGVPQRPSMTSSMQCVQPSLVPHEAFPSAVTSRATYCCPCCFLLPLLPSRALLLFPKPLVLSPC